MSILLWNWRGNIQVGILAQDTDSDSCLSYFFLESSFSGKYRHIPSSPTFWHFWVDDFPWGRHGEQRHASVERLDLLQWQLQGKGWEEMHLGMDSFQVIGWWDGTILKKRSQTLRVGLLEERSGKMTRGASNKKKSFESLWCFISA